MKYATHVSLDIIFSEKGITRENIENVAAEEILELCKDYIPFDEGTLQRSGRVENNNEIVWGRESAPYAHYMWEGIVYEDPTLHCAGFPVADGGWRSRKDVDKVPTDRKLTYGGGGKRGAKWVDKMLQDGGREALQKAIGKVIGK